MSGGRRNVKAPCLLALFGYVPAEFGNGEDDLIFIKCSSAPVLQS